MHPKGHTRSLTLHLFFTVIVVLLTVNFLSMVNALRLISATRANILQQYSSIQSLYMNQLDRELVQTQSRLYSMSRSYDFGLALSGAQEGLDQYEALRSQVALYTQMQEWLTQFPLIDGYFIYQPEGDILIISGDESEAVWEITERLRGQGEEAWNNEMDGKWALKSFSMGDVLLLAGSRRGTQYGAWVQTDRLLRQWGLTERDYCLLPLSSEEGAGFVDTPSQEAQCLLRYRQPEGEMSLPFNVKVLLALTVGMLLSIPFIWLVLRRLVLLPMQELIGAIHRLEGGDITYRIPEKTTSSEFDQLNRQFNRSLDQLAGMRIQMYETKLEKERIQVNYLSQQMQPHFVLNTLNLIYSMEPEEYDLIQSTIVCLSDYYRYVAHIRDPLVPLEAELNHVENYFRLQKTRYPDDFFFRIECPEDLKEQMIPPMVIQTFAENALKHSLKVGERNEVEIWIGREKEGEFHVRIRDHGQGYPEKILSQVRLFQETGEKQPNLGIGIQNTMERMHLIYREEARVSLTNAKGGGAQVSLYFPEREVGR